MTTSSGANLRVKISADLADIKQGLGLLRGELAKVKADAARAAPDTTAWSSGIGKIRNEIGNLAGAYVGIQTITGGITALFDALDRADRMGELAMQAGTSSLELSKMAYAAEFSGVNLESLGDALSKFSRSLITNESLLKKQGIATRDAFDATKFRDTSEIVKDLADRFVQLGPGPQSAALAVKLFGKSASDLLPLLFEGKKGLEDYGKEAEALGRALDNETTNAAGEFNDNLDRLKGTVAGVANETVKNLMPALQGFASNAAAAGESSNFAAEGGKFFATVIKILAGAGIIVKNVVEALTNVVAFFGTVAFEVAKVISGSLVRSLAFVADTARDLLAGKNPIEVFANGIKRGAELARQNMGALKSAMANIKAGHGAASEGILGAGRDIVDGMNALFSDMDKGADKASERSKEAAAKAAQARAAIEDMLNGSGKGGGKSGGKPKAQEKIEQLTASTVLLQDEIKRAQKALDDQFENKQIGIADYYAKRVELQHKLIDAQILQLQGELAVTKELGRRRSLEEQIIMLQRDRQQVAIAAANEQKKAEEALNKTKQEGLRDQFSQLTGGLSSTEGALSAQMEAGLVGQVEGERRIREERQKTLDQLKVLRAEQAAYVASLAPDDPAMSEAVEGLNRIDASIAGITMSMQVMKQGAMDAGVSALSTFFTNLRDGAMSAGDAFKQLMSDFARGIYDMMAQAASKRLVSAITGLFSGKDGKSEGESAAAGASKLTSAAAATTVAGTVISLGANQLSKASKELTVAATTLMIANSMGSFGAAHSGGRVGGLRLTRNNINPMVFGAAPRYHGGGVAGLHNDEIPAILKRGEIVRTREQENALQARMNAGQGGSSQPTKVIVVFSEDQLADALAGAAGEKVTVAHVRNNMGAING